MVTVTSEDVCWSIRNVKFIKMKVFTTCRLVMFIAAICFLFLLKLKWPKNESVYDKVVEPSVSTK